MRDAAAAETLCRRALQIRTDKDKGFGDGHPFVIEALCMLGRCARARGDDLAAEAACRKLVAAKIELYGPQHTSVAASLATLGALCAAREEADGASDSFNRAAAIAEAALGPTHANSRALSDCARVLADFHAEYKLSLIHI